MYPSKFCREFCNAFMCLRKGYMAFFLSQMSEKVINQRVIRHFQGQRGQGNYPQPNLWKSCGISAGFAESSRNHPLEISTNGGMCSLWIRWISRKYRVLQDFLQLHCEKIEIFLENRQESPFRNSNIQRQRGFPDWNATAVSTALWRSRMDIHSVILVDKPLQNQAGKGLSTASTSPTTTAEI